MTLASGGSPMFPLVVHQPSSPSIWPSVQSLRRGLSTNPGATMWCVCAPDVSLYQYYMNVLQTFGVHDTQRYTLIGRVCGNTCSIIDGV